MQRPLRRLPAGAVDTHFHVFGPEELYPYSSQRTYTPPDASFESYLRLAAILGIEKAVIVQPSVYGTDNSRTLDTLRNADFPMRAVVVIDNEIADNELEAMHQAGVRGVRINTVFSAAAGIHGARLLADRVRGLGWHLQFLSDISMIDDLRGTVISLDIPVVIDHFGHFQISKGTEAQGFKDLLGLMSDGKAWVKMSGSYRMTGRNNLPYDDIKPIVDALISECPGQLFWGSDWPHPSIQVDMPNDGPLLDMLMGWITDPDQRQQVFVENASRFYGF